MMRNVQMSVAPAKTCPDCAIEVPAEARVCHHCGYRFRPSEQVEKRRGRLGKIAFYVYVLGLWSGGTRVVPEEYERERRKWQQKRADTK